MTDKSQTAAPESDHAWVHDNLAAYLAGGLDPAERARLDDHINGCPDCFDAFTEGRDADRGVSRALSGLTPGEGFHERLMAGFRAKTIVRPGRLFIRRAGYAAAACVALAATGVLANYVMHQSRFNNPLTQMAVADADDASPQFSDALAPFRGKNTNAETTQTLVYDQDKSPSGKKMKFDFKNAQLDTVLNQMADTYGLIVVKTQNLSQQVTVQSRRHTLDETAGLALLSDVMFPLGYGVVTTDVSDGRKVVRVAALGEVKKAQMPVINSGRPEDYPLTDNVITAVIPLKNVDAARLRNDLVPLMSADADVAASSTSNNLIVTDTSAKINRIAQIVQSLDEKQQSDTIQEKMTLQYANAQDMARLLNNLYDPQNTAPQGGGGGAAAAAPGGAAGGSSPGGDYARTARLYADYDTRTNTVVMVGPPDRVQQALALARDADKDPKDDKTLFLYQLKNAQAPDLEPVVNRIFGSQNAATSADSQSGKQVQGLIADAAKLADSSQFEQSAELLKQATTLDPQNESAQLSLRLVENRIIDRQYGDLVKRMGTETMRHDIDNSEKLIPYADVMVYPDNWIDITRKRQTGNAPSANDGIQSNANVSSGFINGGGQNFVSNFSQTTTTGGDPNMPQLKLDASRNSYNNSPSNELATTTEERTLKLVPSADQPEDQKALKDKVAISIGGYVETADKDLTKSDDLAVPNQPDSAIRARRGLPAVANKPDESNGNLVAAQIDRSGGDTSHYSSPDTGSELKSKGAPVGRALRLEPPGQTGKFSAGVGVHGIEADAKASDPNELKAHDFGITAGTNFDLTPDHARLNRTNSDDTGFEFGSQNVRDQHAAAIDGRVSDNKQVEQTPQGFKGDTFAVNNGVHGIDGDPAVADAQRYRATYGWDVAYSREQFDSAQKGTAANGTMTPIATTAPAGAGGGAGAAASTRPAPLADVEQIQRKIIKNGTVEFEVRSFQDTAETISGIVTEEAGFVSSSSSDKLANGKVRGQIVVRVPPDHLDRFLMKIRALGDLKSQQIGATDVTKEFVDIVSELRGLRTMEERLLDLIKNGKGEVKDLVEAEKQLGVYRVRIETLEGQERYYNNLVGMATLTITAYEKDIAKATAASEQELVSVSVETEEVEAKYLSARKILDDAKAHIIESQLKNADADHFAATITADVPPEKADFVAAQLKQLGKVASFTRDRHQTTTNGTAIADTAGPQLQVEQKETRFSISMYNLANLSARETTVLTIAVPNVESTYRKVLTQVRRTSRRIPHQSPVGKRPRPRPKPPALPAASSPPISMARSPIRWSPTSPPKSAAIRPIPSSRPFAIPAKCWPALCKSTRTPPPPPPPSAACRCTWSTSPRSIPKKPSPCSSPCAMSMPPPPR